MSIKIIILGMGGVGAFFASRLASVPNVSISAICRSNCAAVGDQGIRVISPEFGDSTIRLVHVFASVDDAKEAVRTQNLRWDYLIVSTKVLSSQDSSLLLDGLIGDGSSIVLMQNGLDIEDPFRQRYPTTTILSSVTRTSMMKLSEREFKHCYWTKTSIGPYGHKQEDADDVSYQRNATFAQLLMSAGISDVEELDHVGLQFARWHKTAINAALNPTSVLVGGSTNQAMSADDEVYEHQRGIMKEVLETASRVLGQRIPDSLPSCEWVLDNAKQDVSGSFPSMWHDWNSGREVELEAIVGNPLRQARAIGLELPRLQSLYALLRLLQQNRTQSRQQIQENVGV